MHQGRSIAFLEGKLTDSEGRVVAAASATVKLTPPQKDS
jgi:acyl-coenzyme A thioesterase PaaI-like protein